MMLGSNAILALPLHYGWYIKAGKQSDPALKVTLMK